MWSGGLNEINSQEDLAKARENLVELQQDYSDVKQDVSEANEVVTDAQTELSEVRTDEGYARSDESRLNQEARGKYEAAKAAAESADSYRKNAELELKKLEPQERSVAEQFRLARFQKQMYVEETRRMVDKGVSELLAEQQNRDGEVWRAWLAASSKLNSAVAGVSPTSASAALAFPSYYQPSTPPHDSSEQTYANAWASKNSLDAEKENKIENLNDPYYANKAAEKSAEASQANAEYSQAAAEYAAAKSAEGAAEAGWLSAREAAKGAMEAATEVEHDINEANAAVNVYQDEIQAKLYKKQLQEG